MANCKHCGSVLSAVTWECVRGRHCPGQLTIPGCEHEPSRLLLQRKAAAPMVPSKAQLPCDVGLFGDEAAQLDLVEMLQEPTND